MFIKLLEKWLSHFQNNFFLYFLTLVFFVTGLIFGALGVKTLSPDEYQNLSNYFRDFLSSLQHWEINTGNLVQYTIFNHWKTVFLFWFLGLTVIGIPLILIIIFIKGFVLGFTVGFIVQQKSHGGIMLALISILPSNVIIIPVLIVGAVAALAFSLGLVRGRLKKGWGGISPFLITYSILMFFLAAMTVLAGVVEAYITPTLIRFLVGYY